MQNVQAALLSMRRQRSTARDTSGLQDLTSVPKLSPYPSLLPQSAQSCSKRDRAMLLKITQIHKLGFLHVLPHIHFSKYISCISQVPLK